MARVKSLSIDFWKALARRRGWQVEDHAALEEIVDYVPPGEPTVLVLEHEEPGEELRTLVRAGSLRLYSSWEAFMEAALPLAIAVTDRVLPVPQGVQAAFLRPKSLVVGIGCHWGVSQRELMELTMEALEEGSLSPKSVRNLATSEEKTTEYGVSEFAARLGVPVEYIAKERLAVVEGLANPSVVTQLYAGVPSVCEAAALYSAGATELVVPKRKTRNATVAIARVARQQAGGGL